jgi:hypothetical protein
MTEAIKVALIGGFFGLLAGLVPAMWNYRFVERAKQEIEERQVNAKIVVDSAMKEIENRKVEANIATEIRGLVQGIYTSAKPAEADANALAVALFGRDAALPLIHFLDGGSDVPMNAAMKGLRAAGLIDLKGTCPILIGVLDNRTSLYRWSTHKRIIELLMTLACPDAEAALRRYQWLLESTPESYAQSVVVQEPISDRMVELRRDIDEGLRRLSPK